MPEYEQKYKKPPIIEAIIEFQLNGEFKPQTQEKLAKAFKAKYPRNEHEISIDVQVSPDQQQLGLNQKKTGVKLTSADGLNIVLLRPTAVVISRLAPYEGWYDLRGTAEAAWQKISKFVDHRDVKRIGVRYINRLDIPHETIKTGEWVTVGFVLPPGVSDDLDEFALRTITRQDHQGLILGVKSTRSPLIGHCSIILDIDVFCEGESFTTAESLWNMVDVLRDRKNEVFESAVTDATKKLFEPKEQT
jgi:uncharacterized protein (TIGR04255 family)